MTWLHNEPFTLLQKGAFALLIGSVVLVDVEGYRAWSITPLADAPTAAPPQTGPVATQRVTYRVSDAVRAVERDPFHPARRAPAARYLLPEEGDAPARAASGPAAPGQVRLIGTVVSGPGGGFVMGQIGREPPKVLRIGDVLGNLTLRTIERGQADFSQPDGTIVTLRIPGAPSDPGA